MIRPFLRALGLLTTIPLSAKPVNPTPREEGLSLLYYPLVGLLIGLMLSGLHILLQDAPAALQAALVLALWVGITGGLHLDGLGDAADAWIGGGENRTKIMTILKDPRSGPAAISAITLLLLVKFAALQQLSLNFLIFAPIFGRMAIMALLLVLPYIRDYGIGSVLSRNFSKKLGWTIFLLSLLLSLLADTLTEKSLWLPLLFWSASLLFFGWRVKRKIGGVTGDFLGAGCELSETFFLIGSVLSQS